MLSFFFKFGIYALMKPIFFFLQAQNAGRILIVLEVKVCGLCELVKTDACVRQVKGKAASGEI